MLVGRVTSQLLTTPKALLKCSPSLCRFISGVIGSAERDRLHIQNTKVLRPGLMLGHNSDTKKWMVIHATYLSAAEAAGQTTLSVLASSGSGRFVANDNIKIVGPGGIPGEQDLGLLVTANADTLVVTTALVVAYPANSFLYKSAATDYDADVAQGILYEFTAVDDGLGNAADCEAMILTHGVVDSDEIIGSTNLSLGQLMDMTVGDIAHQIGFES